MAKAKLLEDATVTLQIKGIAPPRYDGEKRLPGRELSHLINAIQDQFLRIASIHIEAGQPARFTVIPAIGETLESLTEQARALQEHVLKTGIVA